MEKFIEISEIESIRVFGGKSQEIAMIVEEIARILGSAARVIYNIRQLLKAAKSIV